MMFTDYTLQSTNHVQWNHDRIAHITITSTQHTAPSNRPSTHRRKTIRFITINDRSQSSVLFITRFVRPFVRSHFNFFLSFFRHVTVVVFAAKYILILMVNYLAQFLIGAFDSVLGFLFFDRSAKYSMLAIDLDGEN